MRIQVYRSDYPARTYSALFIPNLGNFEENNEADFLTFTAQNAVTAQEDNKKYNDRKAKWVEGASDSILLAVLMLAFLVGISVYLQVYVVLPVPSKP